MCESVWVCVCVSVCLCVRRTVIASGFIPPSLVVALKNIYHLKKAPSSILTSSLVIMMLWPLTFFCYKLLSPWRSRLYNCAQIFQNTEHAQEAAHLICSVLGVLRNYSSVSCLPGWIPLPLAAAATMCRKLLWVFPHWDNRVCVCVRVRRLSEDLWQRNVLVFLVCVPECRVSVEWPMRLWEAQ